VVPLWAWAAVVAFIVVALLVDLLVFHRDAHVVSVREAATTSIIWIALGLAFGGVVWATLGPQAAGEYYAGYLLEKSLSVDNLFVFVVVFTYFAVPAEVQHRVLFWGVVGALVLRGLFIAAGAALLERFEWTIYLFGAFLLYTAVRMWRSNAEAVHPEHNPVLGLVRRIVPMTKDYDGARFFTRHDSRRLATPLLAVLVVVETTDVLFAVDSIPAVLAITRDTFVVFTSNAFAILGLRALYFLLADMMGRFAHLQYGLAAVLAFVGAKMVTEKWIHVPTWLSLLVIVVLIGSSVAWSLIAPPEPIEEIVHPGEGLAELADEADEE